MADGPGIPRGLDQDELSLAILAADPPLMHRAAEVRRNALLARFRPLELGLVQRHVLPDRGVDLGDAMAHEARARDEDPLDRHRCSLVPRRCAAQRWGRN